MSGSLTAWFPTRDTTQAGVEAEASSRASTASTPIRLACRTKERDSARGPGPRTTFKTFYQKRPFEERRNQTTDQDPVKGRRSPASLDVAQDGDPGVKAQTADHQLGTEEDQRQSRYEAKHSKDAAEILLNRWNQGVSRRAGRRFELIRTRSLV